MILSTHPIALTAMALAGFAGSAQAALIAETSGVCDDCTDGCEGSTLYLSVETTAAAKYTIDTENYTGDRVGMGRLQDRRLDSTPSDRFWNPLVEDRELPLAAADKVCVFREPRTHLGLPGRTGPITDTPTRWSVRRPAVGPGDTSSRQRQQAVPEPTAAVLFGSARSPGACGAAIASAGISKGVGLHQEPDPFLIATPFSTTRWMADHIIQDRHRHRTGIRSRRNGQEEPESKIVHPGQSRAIGRPAPTAPRDPRTRQANVKTIARTDPALGQRVHPL